MPTFTSTTSGLLPTREKQSVALTSVVAAVVLTGMKLVVGILTGSLGILSEALHSGLDLVAAALTYFSVRVSDRPADPDHPFGHGKVEHLSAFAETALLFITCAWIVWEAILRLFFRQVHVEPSLWAFGVMFISITIDTFRSRALFRVARKYNSQALEADALHFSTDVYSSSVVILGLILVSIAEQKKIWWLRDADPLAALIVAGIVVYITLRLGKRTVDALVDAAPEGIAAQISPMIQRVPGVLALDRIRIRQSGSRIFMDLRLTLESNIPLEHAQSVADIVEAEVHSRIPTADVMIHTTPRPPSSGDVVEKIRTVASRHKFLIHDVTAYEVNGRLNVNLDMEVDPGLSLEEAHEQATKLEREIQQGIPEVNEVNVHIEPLLKKVEAANEVRLAPARIERELREFSRQTPGLLDCHSVEAHQVGENVLVRLHCTLEPGLPVSRVHEITDALEFRLRKAFPQIYKVSVHPEPKSPG